MLMENVQNHPDHRQVAIDRVGVRNLRYPIVVRDSKQKQHHTVGDWTMSVSLPHHLKGTHMSRFIEVLDKVRGELSVDNFSNVLLHLKERLDAENAYIEVKFPFFLERKAPVTGQSAFMDYECTFAGGIVGTCVDILLAVRVPVTSLCPCSKAISDYGAHSQRGYVTVETRAIPSRDCEADNLGIEELVEIVERSASSPVYPLLKRADERHVTMQAYNQPVFVEDLVRSVAVHLRSDSRLSWFRIQALNQESIHNHDAFAEIEWQRDPTYEIVAQSETKSNT